MRPEFIDNLAENTMARAIRGYLQDLAQRLRDPVALRVATGYFNPGGYGQLADALESLKETKLLLGAEPLPAPAVPSRKPGDPRGDRLEQARLRDALGSHLKALSRDRDRLPFEPQQDATLKRIVSLVRSGKLKVKRYEKRFLHGKCFLFGSHEGTLVGSSNFTYAGLTTNLELNVGEYQPHVVDSVSTWFDRLWSEAVDFDLAALYEARYVLYEPYLIYLRVLLSLFGGDLTAEAAVSELNLTAFQRDGVFRAERILDDLGGVLIADEVGLGKTFLAGDLLRAALRERRQRVLVVAPAALRDGPWRAFLHKHQLEDAEVVSFEQLHREKRLGAGGEDQVLKDDPNAYALVVVDEAQGFRNPDASRSAALRALLRGTPRKQLILMSATPVNNSVWDLYTLLGYILENDGALADRGIISLEKRFREVAAADPEDLKPDVLFDVLDATTVRRTRHFIKRYYGHERIRGPNGTEIHIHFPKPKVSPVTYDLEAAMPGVFEEIQAALVPDANGVSRLTLARYAPEGYLKRNAGVPATTAALLGLIRTGILKRFESSSHAFAQTLRTLIRSTDAFLKGLDEGRILRGAGLSEIEDLSDTEEWQALLADAGAESTDAYDVGKLRAAVLSDRAILEELLRKVEGHLTSDRDPKLKALEAQLEVILDQAEREDVGDARDRRKVLIFTYFDDTAVWIYEYLEGAFARRRRLAPYRGRLAAVTGERALGGISRDHAIYGFAPKTTEAPAGRDDDLFDVLVTTDILAEGMNLQQCRNIVNYDLPWNPMRLVQRHGRIDRIGSPHDVIYLRCFFPDRLLDQLLDLEAKIRSKLATAAATIGLGAEVIPGSAVADKVFAETRGEIVRLRAGNAELFERSGERPGAHSGEEYRHQLRKALEDAALRLRVEELPGAAGTVLRGAEQGHFFCARIGERTFLRFVPKAADAQIRKDTLSCLRLVACRSDEPLQPAPADLGGAYVAWQRARDDIFSEWQFATDPANIQPRIREPFRSAADHLRRHPPAGVPQEVIRRAVEALEAPRSLRVGKVVRDVLTRSEGPQEVSKGLIKAVEDLGLEPYVAPKPLPPIALDDVELVCWAMVIA